MHHIIAFTDGACTMYKNDKIRYAGVGVYFGDKNKYNVSKGISNEKITNQRSELMGCIYAIKKTLKMMEGCEEDWELTIYSDSKYSINSATIWAKKWILYGWKRKKNSKLDKICNLDLIKKLYKLSCMYPVTYKHVKGHGKEPANKKSDSWKLWHGNQKADELAVCAKHKILKKT
jgi:ribonuclease HI